LQEFKNIMISAAPKIAFPANSNFFMILWFKCYNVKLFRMQAECLTVFLNNVTGFQDWEFF
jgi:hypothetical protein